VTFLVVAADRVNGGLAEFRPADVQLRPLKVDIAPFQVAGFGCPQAVSPDSEQHCIIAVPVTIALSHLEELLAFGLGQILAFTGNCPLFAVGAC
jgi:hypothetical protein